jgi:hypothetical protein
MDLKKFRQIIREEVKKAIQEELKDILSEAVVIASKPEVSPKNESFKPHVKVESNYKPSFSQIMGKEVPLKSTGNPILDLLNETAQSGEWKSLNGGYTSQDAVNWAGGLPGMGGENTPVVDSVEKMIKHQGPVHDINDIRIDAVPDFTGLMGALKEKGKL